MDTCVKTLFLTKVPFWGSMWMELGGTLFSPMYPHSLLSVLLPTTGSGAALRVATLPTEKMGRLFWGWGEKVQLPSLGTKDRSP